ncbi:MAG: (Fe-S)-binding protein [Nitrososphaerota archaeon]|nr:(Fe-S)-binding protein [Aigarchaeota archaeon]MDW8076370.1 (Fe-S)-binding protein [Nitrososphaerota archaeon]
MPFEITVEDALKKLNFCEHCGFCRSVCPVVEAENYDESVSPRGRKTLFLALMTEGLQPTLRLSEKFYKCSTCYSCAYKCPQGINIGEISLLARQKLFELGIVPESTKRLLNTILEFKNVYSMDNASRNDWVMYTDADVKVKDSADTVYFVGCITSFSGMVQTIAQAVTGILNHLNEDWTVLKDEWCCGHPLVLAGALKEAKTLAEHNVKEISSVSPKRVITGCPGCYLALKHEYPKLLGRRPNFEVLHFVEFLENYIKKERLKVPRLDTIITYHDPCELSRAGGIIKEPRNILSSIANPVYPEYSDVYSCCCGGGGLLKANYPSISGFISKRRYDMLTSTKAEIITSACPTCIQNLLQAASSQQNGRRIVDISQLIAEQIGLM